MKKTKILDWVIYIASLIVGLAVGVGVINGTLAVPYIGQTANSVAGWVTIIATVWGVIGKLMK